MTEMIGLGTGELKDPALAAEKSAARAAIEDAMVTLPFLQRGLIELIHFQRMTLADAACELGLPSRAALSTLLLAQAVLYGALKERV